MELASAIIGIVAAVLASSGFWAFMMSRKDRKSSQARMILGLGHDRIIMLCKKYIERGFITADEYENLYNYLFEPYEKMGGNGSAQKLMDEVKHLPIREG
jgi:hypothetical protein